MSVATILLPLFVHVAFTLLLLFRTGPRSAAGEGTAATLLFYTLAILALLTRKADLVFVVLAWLFVAVSVLHRLAAERGVAGLDPAIASRLPLALLAVMWALFAAAILLNI